MSISRALLCICLCICLLARGRASSVGESCNGNESESGLLTGYRSCDTPGQFCDMLGQIGEPKTCQLKIYTAMRDGHADLQIPISADSTNYRGDTEREDDVSKNGESQRQRDLFASNNKVFSTCASTRIESKGYYAGNPTYANLYVDSAAYGTTSNGWNLFRITPSCQGFWVNAHVYLYTADNQAIIDFIATMQVGDTFIAGIHDTGSGIQAAALQAIQSTGATLTSMGFRNSYALITTKTSTGWVNRCERAPANAILICSYCGVGTYAATATGVCTACTAGYSTASTGSTAANACSVCSAGFYGSSVTPNTSGCTACTIGYSTTAAGATAASACSVCTAGYSGAVTTANSAGCTICAAGTYNAAAGNGVTCSVCGAGLYVAASGQLSCTGSCGTGYTTNGGTAAADHDAASDCNYCAAGYYSSTNAAAGSQTANCAAIGPGFRGVNAASGGSYVATGASHREVCATGKYSTDGIGDCPNTCIAGYTTNGSAATDHDAATDCSVCAAGYGGTVTTANSVGCMICAVGYYGTAVTLNTSECTPCAAGYSTASAGSAAANACSVCAAGYGGTTVMPNTSGCTVCAAGTYKGSAGNSACSLCAAGTYSTSVGALVNPCTVCAAGSYAPVPGWSVCSLCPPGKYSNAAGLSVCADAIRGYSTALGASQPTLCEPSFYSDSAGSSACVPCRSGTVTTFFGADSKKQCVSPASNFVQGYIAVAIDVIFGFQYLLRGRFHRVAFVRLKRILESLSTNAGGTITYISYLQIKASSERLNITAGRRSKTWSFILSTAFIFLFVSSLAFLHEFSTVFFKALVIFKSVHLKFDFGAKIAHVISQFGRDVWSQVVTKLLTLLTEVLQYVAYFKIDVTVIAVNCKGATAPFTMFMNILVLGAAMMFIDGRFQEFLLLKCNGLISSHSGIIGKRVVKEWCMRQNGTQTHITKRGKVMYYSISAILLVLKGALSVDLIQTLLQFIISTVNISVFFEKGLLHGYDQNCNVVAGWEGAEASIALLTSVVNWLFIIPAMYTVSRVLIPRLPPGVASFDTTKDGEPLFRSYIGLHRALKLFSYFSPDLWMSFLTSKYLHNLPYFIPARASVSSVSLYKRKAEELRAADDTPKVGSDHSDAAEGSALEQATLLSAIETPLYPTYRIACNAKAPYIGLYRCKSIACKYKMWHAPQMYLTDAGDNYVLVKIARSTGLVESTLTYDVYHEGLNAEGRNAADLAVELNSTSDHFVVVLIVLANEHTSHRLEGGLAEAVLRCGGSREIFGASKLQGSFLLIGVPGCGDGNGYECVSVNSEVEFSVDFSVLKPEHGKLGWKVYEEISSSKSFLNVASKIRTKRENMEWKRFKQMTLPTYWDLCVMEYKIMLTALFQQCGGNSCLLSIMLTSVLAILTAVGLGHAVTSVGRRAMYVVYWNYSRFLMFAAGIVTTDLAYIFDIHEKIHRDSCVWNDASVVASHRLQDIVSQPGDNQLFTDKQSSSLSSHNGDSSEAGLPTSANMDKAANHNNDGGAVLQSDSQQQYSRYEERKTVLERQVLQKQLRADYGICLYASIATRATLLQLFPYISFLSIFAAFTSTTPYFVYDKYLESNLQEGFVFDAFSRWRQMAQQEIDLEYELRTKEMREDSYVLPVPPEGETNAYGTRVEVDTKNKISREIFKQAAAQDKPLVREWEVRLQGVVWYVTGSRYIQYGKGVFKFIMSLLLLYCDERRSKLLVGVMLLGLSPFVLVACLQVVIVLGTSGSMCITDEELLKERDWVLRSLQDAYRYLYDCFARCISKVKAATATNKSQFDRSAEDTRPSPDQPSLADEKHSTVEEQADSTTVEENSYVVNPIVPVRSASISGGFEAAPSLVVAAKAKRGSSVEMSELAAGSATATAVLTTAATFDSLQGANITSGRSAAPSASVMLPASAAPYKPMTKDSGNVAALSRSRAMAMEFEDIAERASMSSASTSRKLELEALPHIPTDGEDAAHSLSRSRKMALEFEEIAERVALGSAADLDLAGKEK